MNWFDLFLYYGKLGFTHVIPLGFDHILFILSLFLLSSEFKKVLIHCSIFTMAHSISLALASAGVIYSNSAIIEPLIAFSILFTAIENIIGDKMKQGRPLLIFTFGLIHGMGFASAFAEFGLPKQEFITALISFNIGVEIGQVCVLILAWLLIAKWFSSKVWYKTRLVYPLSSLIACIAVYWLVERLNLM